MWEHTPGLYTTSTWDIAWGAAARITSRSNGTSPGPHAAAMVHVIHAPISGAFS